MEERVNAGVVCVEIYFFMTTSEQNNKFPRGSEWRKWDLHVHSPASAFANGFVGDTIEQKWINYFTKLASLTDISVLGITDYFSIEGYKKTIVDGNLNNFDLIVPNVELRILPVTESDTPINIHIIFDPSIVDELESKFFSSLEYSYAGDTYKCTRLELIKLGRKFRNNSSLEEDAAYIDGVEQFKTTVPNLASIFDKNKILREKSIVIVSNSSDDGNSGIQHSSIASTREEIYRFSHAVFSGNPSDCAFFLGLGSESRDEVIRKYGSLKPCIHGCDAHKLERIGSPCIKRGVANHNCETALDCEMRFCWIKADPTFDGLKQIIFEPDERVKIQENTPHDDRNKIFFNSLKLTGSTNFIISDFELPLNRELVALIGGRGTGKTALLDTFAFLNEEHVKRDQNGKNKIIEYYRENENKSEPAPNFSLKTAIVDKDGNSTDISKDLFDYSNLELPFLYLGQEQLSGIATNDFELTRTVCQLIGIDVNEIGQETLVSKARSILSDDENNQKQIEDITNRYTSLGYSGKTNIEKWMKEYLSKLTDQRKRLSSEKTREVLEDINKKIEKGLRLKDLNEKAETLQLGLRKVTTNDDITRFNSDFQKLYPSITPIILLDSSRQMDSLKILQEKIKVDMDALRTDIYKQKQILIRQGIKEDVNSLLQANENLQKQINSVEKDLKNFAEGKAKAEEFHKEKVEVLNNIKSSLMSLSDTITSKFVDFEKSRSDSSPEEKELFESMVRGISIAGQVEFNEKKFAEELLHNYIDNRKVPNKTELKKIISGENSDGTAKDITMENLFAWVQSDLSLEKVFNTGGLKGLIKYVFTEWFNFLNVKAVVKLNGKVTEILSIGQRGTLLLKVYLATSTAKQVFIIDQPEDNLDNCFIMNELVPLIRKAKKTRQIIMSTHNANLVVNADAEQIIIAQLGQEKNYLSGSIENPEINKNIRDILEGGEEAFRKREQKYIAVK